MPSTAELQECKAQADAEFQRLIEEDEEWEVAEEKWRAEEKQKAEEAEEKWKSEEKQKCYDLNLAMSQ